MYFLSVFSSPRMTKKRYSTRKYLFLFCLLVLVMAKVECSTYEDNNGSKNTVEEENRNIRKSQEVMTPAADQKTVERSQVDGTNITLQDGTANLEPTVQQAANSTTDNTQEESSTNQNNTENMSPTNTEQDVSTPSPTRSPMVQPQKTPAPTQKPTLSPTKKPTLSPTKTPVQSPVKTSTKVPVIAPNSQPTTTPTKKPQAVIPADDAVGRDEDAGLPPWLAYTMLLLLAGVCVYNARRFMIAPPRTSRGQYQTISTSDHAAVGDDDDDDWGWGDDESPSARVDVEMPSKRHHEVSPYSEPKKTPPMQKKRLIRRSQSREATPDSVDTPNVTITRNTSSSSAPSSGNVTRVTKVSARKPAAPKSSPIVPPNKSTTADIFSEFGLAAQPAIPHTPTVVSNRGPGVAPAVAQRTRLAPHTTGDDNWGEDTWGDDDLRDLDTNTDAAPDKWDDDADLDDLLND